MLRTGNSRNKKISCQGLRGVKLRVSASAFMVSLGVMKTFKNQINRMASCLVDILKITESYICVTSLCLSCQLPNDTETYYL